MERVPILPDMRDSRKVPPVAPYGAIEQHGADDVTVRNLHRGLIEISDQHQLLRADPLSFERADA